MDTLNLIKYYFIIWYLVFVLFCSLITYDKEVLKISKIILTFSSRLSTYIKKYGYIFNIIIELYF